MANLIDACRPYSFAFNGLDLMEGGPQRAELEAEFNECAEALRLLLCEELKKPATTTWKEIRTLAGWRTNMPDTDQDIRYNFAVSVQLSPEAAELCERLELIRSKITGALL